MPEPGKADKWRTQVLYPFDGKWYEVPDHAICITTDDDGIVRWHDAIAHPRSMSGVWGIGIDEPRSRWEEGYGAHSAILYKPDPLIRCDGYWDSLAIIVRPKHKGEPMTIDRNRSAFIVTIDAEKRAELDKALGMLNTPEMLVIALQCCGVAMIGVGAEMIRERYKERARVMELTGNPQIISDLDAIQPPAVAVEFLGIASNGDWLFAAQAKKENP